MTKKLTTNEFKQRIKALTHGEYLVLGNYVNYETKVKMLHVVCGSQFMIAPKHFINAGCRCPKCAVSKRAMIFKQRVKALTHGEYLVLGDYVNARTKIKMLHVTCGHVFMMRPDSFLHGQRCPKCRRKQAGAKRTMTTATFKQRVKALTNGKYQALGDYVNSHTKIKMLHATCGHVFMMTPNSFISGNRCPYCNQSHGELFVEHYLKQHRLHYVAQKKFADLHDKRLLSYDFCINHHVLIEYQGVQHYQACDHFGGQATFAKQQKHDGMKKQYAKTHHYVLLAIPYTYDTQAAVNHYLNHQLPCMRH